MAGRVALQVHKQLSSDQRALVPDICPATDRDWQRPFCVETNIREGHQNWCPFAYGLELHRGGSSYDIGRGGQVYSWLGDYGHEMDAWTCLCLRKESAGTHPGARYRP